MFSQANKALSKDEVFEIMGSYYGNAHYRDAQRLAWSAHDLELTKHILDEVNALGYKYSNLSKLCEYEMYQSKPQTQICIFESQIYSFLFQPSVQTTRKYPKSLENKAFSAISCKIVISDKW